MRSSTTSTLRLIQTTALLACFALQTGAAMAEDLMLGHLKVNRVLFLGNSITLHGPYITWLPDAHWGMAASEESKDYVHLLTQRISTTAGGAIELAAPDPLPDRWYAGDPLPNYNGNILNIADIFERTYATWDNARIQNQLDAKPDLVVLQFGENMEGGTMEQFSTALNTLLDGLKAASDPQIVLTSFIIGSNPEVDEIKRQACAADPQHRIFIDLVGRVDLSGAAGHPNDAGMQTIANTLYDAIEARSTPEPASVVMLTSVAIMAIGYWWRTRRTKS